jgi:DNA-binding beta-propeller fold protein YncE
MKWHIGDSNGTNIAGIVASTGASSSQLNYPTGIVLDQWHNIYVNDRSNNRIQFFCNGSSTAITIAGASTGGTAFGMPFDVKLDSHLNLYVADSANNRVMKFSKL